MTPQPPEVAALLARSNRLGSDPRNTNYAGGNTSDQSTANWKIPRDGTAIVHIDLDPVELGRNYTGAIGLQADVRAALERAGFPEPAFEGFEVVELFTTDRIAAHAAAPACGQGEWARWTLRPASAQTVRDHR